MTARRDLSKSDGYTRQRQAAKWVRLIKIHRTTWKIEGVIPDEVVERLAKELNVSVRTVYRDLQNLRMAYQEIGSRDFNPEE